MMAHPVPSAAQTALYECLGGPLDGEDRPVPTGCHTLCHRTNDGSWHTYRLTTTDGHWVLTYAGLA